MPGPRCKSSRCLNAHITCLRGSQVQKQSLTASSGFTSCSLFCPDTMRHAVDPSDELTVVRGHEHVHQSSDVECRLVSQAVAQRDMRGSAGPNDELVGNLAIGNAPTYFIHDQSSETPNPESHTCPQPRPYRPIVRWRRQHPLFSKPLPSCSANGARTRPEALRKPGGGCKGIQKGHKDDTCSG